MTTTERGRRRRRTTTAFLASVLLLTGCGSDDGSPDDGGGPAGASEPADPMSSAPQPDATFHATVTPGDGGIEISYTVRNTGETELLLVNGIPRPVGAGVKYLPDLAYVTGRNAKGVLVSHRAFPWPEPARKSWAAPPQVGVTRLPGGEQIRVDLTVPVPLERRQPFGEDLGYGPIRLPDPAGEVTFCLGVIASPYDRSLGLRAGPEGDTIAHGNAAHDAQYLFCSESVPVES